MARAWTSRCVAAMTIILVCAALAVTGCENLSPGKPVPYPINLTLPHKIRVHSFTATKAFGPTQKGVEVHVEALDAYGDPTKAFGEFRFSLYEFKKQSPDPKGKLINVWSQSVLTPEKNAQHWSGVSHTYVFKLDCARELPGGHQFVVEAEFASPYTDRIFDSKVITAWQ